MLTKLFLSFFFLLINICNCFPQSKPDLFIRTSQVGFLPGDEKSALVISKIPLDTNTFTVTDINSGIEVFNGKLILSSDSLTNFGFIYSAVFSQLKDEGEYYLSANGERSFPFSISDSVFNSLRDSLSLFFKIQRCGPTNPLLHKPCHLSDVSKIIGDEDSSAIDLTGGWHDAGDYIKFVNTTAYVTYLLVFSFEYDKEKFSYDLDKNNVPDILEEARVGLDWLLRANFKDEKLVSQVQDVSDHKQGWRLPENDKLQFERVGYVSIGKNTIGIYTAALVLASRIWRERFMDNIFADRCLNSAVKLYNIRDEVPDIDSVFSDHYVDSDYKGKLSLAAIELFLETNDTSYLNEAIQYAEETIPEKWWSWGDINSLAYYKLASYDPNYIEKLKENLEWFSDYSRTSSFNLAIPFTWGTTNTLLGVSLQAILFKRLTGETDFDNLMNLQRDYVLGRNPWGISFIYGIGKLYPQKLHSQIAYFNNGYLPGALTAGPAPINLYDKYNVEIKESKFAHFNPTGSVYQDDWFDFICNEPTISGNATALFVFGNLSN